MSFDYQNILLKRMRIRNNNLKLKFSCIKKKKNFWGKHDIVWQKLEQYRPSQKEYTQNNKIIYL